MKNKFVLTAMLVVLAMFVTFSLVSAAGLSSTWNSKGATGLNYSNKTGSFTFNCTATAKAVTNVTIYANSSSGVMNPLQSFANTSANQAAWTGTVTITSADDGSNQNLSCYVRNATAAAYSSEKGAWHVRLDSTNPKCNVTVLHHNFAYKANQRVIYASSDALLRKATTVDINGPQDQTTITVTAASRTVELGSNDTKYFGDWTANMTVTDSAGNSCTDSVTFKSYLPDGNQQVTTTSSTSGTDSKTLLIIGGLLVAAYFVFKKK